MGWGFSWNTLTGRWITARRPAPIYRRTSPPVGWTGRSNKKVLQFYKDRVCFDVDLTAIETGNEKDYIEQLKADLKEQHDRKKIIEDKSKSLLFIIAVSITAITFSLTYLNLITFTVYQVVALVFLGISILYFVQGVIKALQALNIRQFNVIQAEVEIAEQNYKLVAKKSDFV